MEEIYSSRYIEVKYSEPDKLLEVVWKKDLLELDVDEYKRQSYNMVEALYDYDVNLVLQDALEAVYPLTESLNKWIKNNISKAFIENSVKKIAYVMPQDIITQLGLELLVQTAQEEYSGPVRRFFSSYEEAQKWLFEKE